MKAPSWLFIVIFAALLLFSPGTAVSAESGDASDEYEELEADDEEDDDYAEENNDENSGEADELEPDNEDGEDLEPDGDESENQDNTDVNKDNIESPPSEGSEDEPYTKIQMKVNRIKGSKSIELEAVIPRGTRADGIEIECEIDGEWKSVFESGDFVSYTDKKISQGVSVVFNDLGLTPDSEYKYRVRAFSGKDGDEREYLIEKTYTIKTLMAAPELQLSANTKKSRLTWSNVDNADGYQICYYTVDIDSQMGHESLYSPELAQTEHTYNSMTLNLNKDVKFKKGFETEEAGKTTLKCTLKEGKVYVYKVRAYRNTENGKEYGEFSQTRSTDSTSSILNGAKRVPKEICPEEKMEIVKSSLEKCIDENMSPAQKAAAVYNYVNSAAVYEDNPDTINSDPVSAILEDGRGQCYQYAAAYQAMMAYIGFDITLVQGKNSSGKNHWWNELTLGGTDYMFDTQVGGRFMLRYDQMGSSAPVKEHEYDSPYGIEWKSFG